jgi:O-antigen/teichoic acid export membrane protein
MIPHYALYARRLDGAVFRSAFSGLVVAVACNVIFVPTMGPIGATLATGLGMSVVTGSKVLVWVYDRSKKPGLPEPIPTERVVF